MYTLPYLLLSFIFLSACIPLDGHEGVEMISKQNSSEKKKSGTKVLGQKKHARKDGKNSLKLFLYK